MIEDTNKLIENRKSLTECKKEINRLNLENVELWNKIITEFNENKARFRKVEGLGGLVQALPIFADDEELVVQFDKNSTISAKGLGFLEDETGLKFSGIKGNEFDRFIFKL